MKDRKLRLPSRFWEIDAIAVDRRIARFLGSRWNWGLMEQLELARLNVLRLIVVIVEKLGFIIHFGIIDSI